MNESSRISPDDPRLTAYALNEMEPGERAEFERLLRQDPVAQRQVEEIAALGRDLDHALAGEPLPPAAPLPLSIPAHDTFPKVRRFPYYWVSGLAAACFAIGFIVWQANYQAPMRTQLVEVNLQPSPGGTGAAAPSSPLPDGESPTAGTTAAAEKSASEFVVVALPPVSEDARKAEVVAQAEKTFADPNLPGPGPQDVGRLWAPAAPPAASVLTEAKVATVGEAKRHAESVPVPLDPIVTGVVAGAGAGAGGASGSGLAGGNATFGSGHAAPGTQRTGEETIQLQAFTVAAEPRETAVGRSYRMGASAIPPSRGKREAVGSDLMAVAPPPRVDHNTEAYDRVVDNSFIVAAQQPLSTFSIDVDTASYANLRRFLQGGTRPPRDAVRIEELVNYFPYEYAGPQDRDLPFAAAMEVASAPWKPEHRLVRIGLKGREIPASERPDANLVFLIDVSGSMRPENKLPLVKRSLRLLVDQLRPDDRVALAVYAGSAGLVLPSTRAADKRAILEAIDRLDAGGSTNGAMGIHLAYDVAKANFIPGGVNRLILCTDGDFNVGVTNRGDLVRLVEEKAKSGVFLTVLGFGMGNYQDATLEQLADRGNGNHGYVDSLREAQKLLIEQAGGTLVTIAKDVKIQVDFNPAQVQAYRLIGYENRLLRAEDFNNDQIDAGEIGAGHTVTALYEVVPVGVEWKPESTVDASRYQVVDKGTGVRGQGVGLRGQESEMANQESGQRELLTLKLRYKEPDGIMSRLREYPLVDAGRRFDEASMDFRFAASVAAFGMILRDSPHKGSATLADVTAWASSGTGRDAGGHRTEFLGLVKLAEPLLK